MRDAHRAGTHTVSDSRAVHKIVSRQSGLRSTLSADFAVQRPPVVGGRNSNRRLPVLQESIGRTLKEASPPFEFICDPRRPKPLPIMRLY